jgi:hypothetical protein
VEIEAGIHLDTGEVYARFQSLNPTNGLPPPVDIGFLPPNVTEGPGAGRGQGHLSYVIRANTNLVSTGTEIRNVAWITFDQQPAIGTDWKDPHNPGLGIDTNKQALVTIDADPPTSSVASLPSEAPSAWFNVAWAGNDAGAGVTGYDVFVATNDSPWVLWLNNTPQTSERFLGRSSTAYCFYSQGRDGTGQLQPTNSLVVVCTTTPTNSSPWFEPLPTNFFVMRVNETLYVTNAASDLDVPAQELTFSLDPGAPAGASIDSGNGLFRWTPACYQGNSNYVIAVRVSDNGTPERSAATNFTVAVLECVEASLGGTVMAVGTSSTVAVWLLSTVELTNLSFTVVNPFERFTNFYVTNIQHVSTAELATTNGTNLLIRFQLPANRILRGPTNVAELWLEALAGQTSAFVRLPVIDVDGRKPDGNPVANAYGYPGRVVVVGNESLLEIRRRSNAPPELLLYGPVGTNHRLKATATVADTNSWRTVWSQPLDSLFQVIDPGPWTNQMQFFKGESP